MYFYVIDNFIKVNVIVIKQNVLKLFNGFGFGVLKFEGCSGIVLFDFVIGSWSVVVQDFYYDFMLFIFIEWVVCFD